MVVAGASAVLADVVAPKPIFWISGKDSLPFTPTIATCTIAGWPFPQQAEALSLESGTSYGFPTTEPAIEAKTRSGTYDI